MVEFTLFLFIVGGTKFWNNSLHAIAVSLNPAFTTQLHVQVGQLRLMTNTGFYWRIIRASLLPHLTLLCSGIVVLGNVVSTQ
jgi:hypothetical protein